MRAFFFALAIIVLAGRAAAQPCITTAQNCGPPPTAQYTTPTNNPFLDLSVPNSDGSGNSTTVPLAYTSYAANFVATSSTTLLTIMLRDDHAFLDLANVSLIDVTAGSGNLLTNGDFSAGTIGASAPTGWTYVVPTYDVTQGGSDGGELTAGCGPTGGNCYHDGATQGYDGIQQSVATTVGHTYRVSFQLIGRTPTFSPFSRLSTNGQILGRTGNGIDVIVYGGNAAGGRPRVVLVQ